MSSGDVIQDCDVFSYYMVCVVYISLIVISAIFIDDLTLVFGLIGAFSETMLNFVFPGLFFLIGSTIMLTSQDKREVEQSDDDNYQSGSSPRGAACQIFCKKLPVYLFIVTGIGFFFTSNFFNILKILRL